MAMSILQIIQTACRRIGILAPNAAITSNDQQIMQLVALSEEEGQELTVRYPWQALQTEALFTTVAATPQGALSTIAPGLKKIVNETIWNRTLRRPVYGPRSESDWQQAVASQINGPFNSFRVINDAITFYPVPVAGQLCAFEYISRNWINTSTSMTSEVWTNDADTPKLDAQIILLGTIWRWKQAKGLDYAEDFAKYERVVTDLSAADGAKPILSTAGISQYEIQPVIAIPRGSFGQ